MNKRITILGGGNMGHAMVAGLIAQGYAKHLIYVVDHKMENCETFLPYGIQSDDNYQAGVQQAEIIILAVKPQSFAELFSQIKSFILPAQFIVSIMAGFRLALLADYFPANPIARAMPNTPSRIQAGLTLLLANQNVTDMREIEMVFQSLGQTYIAPNEAVFEKLTAFTSCGPAFVFYLVEAYTKAMQEITPDVDCLPLAITTFQGALALMQHSNSSAEDLIAAVSPKGGMTFEGMQVLRAADIPSLFQDTFKAAIDRADALADLVKK